MKNNFILAFALIILASASFSSALNVDITIPVSSNSSTYNVNNSIYWQGHTGTDGSWLTGIVYSETDPNSLHLNKDNWFGDSWITYTNPNFIFNESKLSTIYYNATQSNIVKGTIDGGTLANTQHQDGKYDGVTFNFSEASGSPALDLRMNFTGITSFTNGVMRYKTSSLAGDYPIIQLWNYDTNTWEDYPAVAQSSNFATITQPVFDSSEHVSGGVAQMRLYKASNGNTNNHYYVDWIAISKGYGTPAGEEVDPLSFRKNQNLNNSGYNITTDYFFGDGSQLTGVAQYQFGSNNFNGLGNVTAGIIIGKFGTPLDYWETETISFGGYNYATLIPTSESSDAGMIKGGLYILPSTGASSTFFSLTDGIDGGWNIVNDFSDDFGYGAGTLVFDNSYTNIGVQYNVKITSTGAIQGTGFAIQSATHTAGKFLRADGTNFKASTLILPNSATLKRVVYANATNAWGDSASLTFDGTNLTAGGFITTGPGTFGNATISDVLKLTPRTGAITCGVSLNNSFIANLSGIYACGTTGGAVKIA